VQAERATLTSLYSELVTEVDAARQAEPAAEAPPETQHAPTP
jgi:hypothetical protein